MVAVLAERRPKDVRSPKKAPKDVRSATLARVDALPYSLKGFVVFCTVLRVESGEPLVLEPFEREMLADFFDGAVESLIIIPSGNGKTTLLSALALYHIRKVESAECVIGAASRDQATVLFRQAETMVARSELNDVFDVKGGYRHIRCGRGRIRVMASGADTGDGIIPTLALVDELHRHPSGELYGVFRFKIVKRRGQMVTISTAGSSMASPLGMLRQAAYELPRFERDEAAKHTIARSDDGSFVMHEWCLSDTDDPNDMKLVAKANPSSWKTAVELKALASSPSMTPWEWLRFACGVWTEGEEPAIDPPTWDALADESLVIADGSEVWIGVDVGTFGEPTAIAVIREESGEIWAKVHMLNPVGNARVPLEQVEVVLRQMHETYAVRAFVYDTRSFQRSADMLEADGLPMVEFPQSAERLTLASGTFFKLVEEGLLHHDGDPVLRAHVLGARVKDDERGWRFRKDPRSQRPTDALFALAVTAHVALTEPAAPEPAFFSLAPRKAG